MRHHITALVLFVLGGLGLLLTSFDILQSDDFNLAFFSLALVAFGLAVESAAHDHRV